MRDYEVDEFELLDLTPASSGSWWEPASGAYREWGFTEMFNVLDEDLSVFPEVGQHFEWDGVVWDKEGDMWDAKFQVWIEAAPVLYPDGTIYVEVDGWAEHHGWPPMQSLKGRE